MYQLEGSFPNMFPHPKFMNEAEIKHGRMAMLAWTGVWATEMGFHFPGAPVADTWTNGLSVWAKEDPGGFGAILLFISLAEGESVGHSGDNFRGMSTKVAGDLGFDWMGMQKKLPAEEAARYKVVELKNGRSVMNATASLFAWKSIPGSVPLMNLFSQDTLAVE